MQARMASYRASDRTTYREKGGKIFSTGCNIQHQPHVKYNFVFCSKHLNGLELSIFSQDGIKRDPAHACARTHIPPPRTHTKLTITLPEDSRWLATVTPNHMSWTIFFRGSPERDRWDRKRENVINEDIPPHSSPFLEKRGRRFLQLLERYPLPESHCMRKTIPGK